MRDTGGIPGRSGATPKVQTYDQRPNTENRSLLYETRATSARTLTGIGRCCGRMSAKPVRRMPYATRMPNAIAPTEAHINIAKFNASVIVSLSTDSLEYLRTVPRRDFSNRF